jgi:hypothetical protein
MPLFLRDGRVEIRLLCVLLLRRLYGTSGNVGVAIPCANYSAASSVNVASSSSAAKVNVNINVAVGDCAP